ncbi:ATP-binding protein [Pseudoalteromonas fenneropenaei]|uniref:histidine kinase n=1 Tax=Pseudoalteromonas fenneropenaei TaxID=1737459 RepID=A0ABV7CH55_9GAMM
MKLQRSLWYFKAAAVAGVLVIAIGSALVYEQMRLSSILTKTLDGIQNTINQLVDQETAFFIDRTRHALKDLSPLLAQYQLQQQQLLAQLDGANNAVERVLALDASVQRYGQIYAEMTVLRLQQGIDEESGRYGDFRRAVHALHVASENLQDLVLGAQLLELRRNEKDFLLRSDEQYLLNHTRLATELNDYLLTLPEPTGHALSALLAQYLESFRSYVALLKQLGLSPQQGLRGESLTAQQVMRTQLTALSEFLLTHSEQQSERLLWWVLLLMIVISSATYALLNYLNGRVSSDILKINKVLHKVTQDEDFSLRVDNQGQDEIAQIAQQVDSLLAFIETLLSRLSAAQQRLIEEAKMASLGNMVSGFAHELNTPIGIAITSHSHLKERMDNLKQDFERGNLRKQSLSSLINEAESALQLLECNLYRTANLIDDFKLVAAQRDYEGETEFNLQALVQGVLDCYQNELQTEEYHVQLEIPAELYLTSYPASFNQIFRYAINNCIRHAKIPEQVLTITITSMIVNDYLHIYLKDDGQGIPRELLPVVFEPFVTSKRNQGGTGLGLSIIYNLVSQNLKGEVKIQSPGGKGVCLHFIFPQLKYRIEEN